MLPFHSGVNLQKALEGLGFRDFGLGSKLLEETWFRNWGTTEIITSSSSLSFSIVFLFSRFRVRGFDRGCLLCVKREGWTCMLLSASHSLEPYNLRLKPRATTMGP